MKKLLLLLLCMIFLIGIVSPADFDDVKYYNDETTTYTLENFFGLGKHIAELELQTPQVFVIPMGYQKVAEIEIRNGEFDYDEIINGIELYNIKDGMKEFVRDVDYKYLGYEKVLDDCIEKEYENGTIKKCPDNPKKLVWLDFTKNSLLKGENITLGLFTYVYEYDKVEWILNVYGSERLTKWASFVQSSGTETIDGAYTIQTFTSNGTFNVSVGTLNVSVLVIAGGGSGGTGGGGGGGAGGYLYYNAHDVSIGNYDVTIGAGGASQASTNSNGSKGLNSSFDTLIADGGGAGGYYSGNGGDGGSGGGGYPAGGTGSQGFDGGIGDPDGDYEGGGGGGAGAIGATGAVSGNGGNGNTSTIYNGTALYYSGGGGGGANVGGGQSVGGLGGGGAGALQGSTSPIAGTANTGGGGGGSFTGGTGAGGSGIVIIRYLTSDVAPVPTISLDVPANTTNFTNNNIVFNATIYDNTNITNVSLILDNQYNETNTTAGLNNTVWTFNKIISDGNHWWTMEACNFENNCINASSRTFSVDVTIPAVLLLAPNLTINHHVINTNLSVNWSANDTHLDTCVLQFEGVNRTVTCSDNQTQINITNFINKSIIFYVNDTFGHMNSTSRTWVYRVFESQPTFNPTTIEGTSETYVANVTLGTGESISLVNLSYNNVGQSVSLVSLGGNMFNLTSTFLVPSVAADTNLTFFWIIDLNSGVQVNTSSNNQTVKNIAIDNCSTFTTLIFNYTIVDEENQSALTNTSFELSINISDQTKTTEILNFSSDYGAANPAAICLNINLTSNIAYALDSTVKYEGVDHVIEYYNIQNFTLQNSSIPQEITLYDLLTADSTEFQITFKDSNFVAVENALIQINRQYVSEGLFKTVEIPKTDSNGQTVVYLVEKDVVYNIIVLKEGIVLGTFNNIIAFCEDVLTGSCFISLNALEVGEEIFDYDEEIGLISSFDYNETTRNLLFTFSTTDGSVKNVSLSAVKIDQIGNDTVCTPSLVSASGSLTCPVPISVGNETIIVEIYVDGDLKITNYIAGGRAFDIGDAGYFLMFFLVLSLALMMTQSKTGVIIGVLVGFIASVLLSFIQGGIVGIGSSTIWLTITAIILIWKLNSQRIP